MEIKVVWMRSASVERRSDGGLLTSYDTIPRCLKVGSSETGHSSGVAPSYEISFLQQRHEARFGTLDVRLGVALRWR